MDNFSVGGKPTKCNDSETAGKQNKDLFINWKGE